MHKKVVKHLWSFLSQRQFNTIFVMQIPGGENGGFIPGQGTKVPHAEEHLTLSMATEQQNKEPACCS